MTSPFDHSSRASRAQDRIANALDLCRSIESKELDSIAGWDATDELTNVRAAIDKLIEASETLDLLT